MLSEEALILIAVVGACALLILGIIELIWPSQPRHPVRRLQPAKTPTTPTRLAPPGPVKGPPPVAAKFTPPDPAKATPPVEPATRTRRSKVSPHARPHAGQPEHVTAREPLPPRVPPVPVVGPAPDAKTPAAPPAPVPRVPDMAKPPVAAPHVSVPPVKPELLPEPILATVTPPPPPPAPPPEPLRRPPPGATLRIDPLLVERCFAYYQERRYDEVVSVGEEALVRLGDAPLSTREAREAAALWSVVALARQAVGDDDGASRALDAALRVAPPDERETYQQHIAALALSAARTALARAADHDTDDRIAELRGALAWTARGLGAVPSDERLSGTRESARAQLWPAYEQAVHKLLQRQEFRQARRLLREALDDPEIPAARVAAFEGLLSGTFGGEIGQLTAQAIRSMQEARESEALGSLRRAEELLETIPDAALPPKRREEVDQRLWWGYTRLGVRRLEAGDYEDAVDPLVRALKLPDVSPDRQTETRAALVRALEGVANLRTLSIRQLNDAGDREGAVLRTETLRELLQSCMELGVSMEELSVAFARIQRLCEELGMEDRA